MDRRRRRERSLHCAGGTFFVGFDSMIIPCPPPISAPHAQALPPLSFLGFRAGMPVTEAVSLIRASRGTLTCKATADSRMRDCTGRVSTPETGTPLELLISSVRDSAAVIVFSLHGGTGPVAKWVSALTTQLGRPNRQQHPGGRSSWQWIRAGTMLRVAQRGSGPQAEASITLTHGPLLDRLGPVQSKRPDAEVRPF